MSQTFISQSLSETRSKDKRRDPWVTLARRSSLVEAAEGMKRIFLPGDRLRKPEQYRIVHLSGGKTVAIYPVVDTTGRISA